MNKIALLALTVAAAGAAFAEDASSGAAGIQNAAPESISLARDNYIAFGPAYQHLDYKTHAGTSSKTGDVQNQYGLTFDYGRYFGDTQLGVHELGVNLSAVTGTESVSGTDIMVTEGSTSLYYNYNFHAGKSTLIYLGPRLGVSRIGVELTRGSYNEDSSDFAAKAGLALGVKQKFSDSFGMTFGLEYSVIGDTEFGFAGGTVTATDMTATKAVVSFAWNF